MNIREESKENQNFWQTINRPILVLAPMAGYTDQPFRLICQEFGADVLFSEMISSEALFHNAISKLQFPISKQIQNSNFPILKTLELIRFSSIEQPFVVQIFGANPEHLTDVAEYISSGKWKKDLDKILNSKLKTLNKFKVQNPNSKNNISLGFRISDLEFPSIPSGIDVNMGCPARDVIKTGAGAALMKNPKLAGQIIKSIKKKTKLPLSVKTRLGWNDGKNIMKFARILEDSGVDAITVHGRTYKQGFTGEVDWKMIYKVKKQLKIPVIGNGGIDENFQFPCLAARRAISNFQLDGYMIGRGALGRPWIFDKLKVKNEKLKIKVSLRDDYSLDFVKKIVLKHAELIQQLKGEQGIVEFRKHLGWYFKHMPDASKIRQQLVRVDNLGDIRKVLSDY